MFVNYPDVNGDVVHYRQSFHIGAAVYAPARISDAADMDYCQPECDSIESVHMEKNQNSQFCITK